MVGVEGVEKPVREFFEVHSDLQHSVEDLPFGKLYKVRGKRWVDSLVRKKKQLS